MTPIQSLLDERKRILAELGALEHLLRSRFNWKAEESEGADSVDRRRIQPAGPATPRRKPSATRSIDYSAEMEFWILQAPEEFTVIDFREYLADKHGAENVNFSSLNGPMKKLENEKRIFAFRRGTGRRPTVYRLTKEKPTP
jgi:hypothetical protein